jgi:hypothetical protein
MTDITVGLEHRWYVIRTQEMSNLNLQDIENN